MPGGDSEHILYRRAGIVILFSFSLASCGHHKDASPDEARRRAAAMAKVYAVQAQADAARAARLRGEDAREKMNFVQSEVDPR